MIQNILFFKTSANVDFLRYFFFVLFILCVTTNCVECGACENDAPCLGRGGCYYNKETVERTFFATRCICVKGFNGRWCQYRDQNTISKESENENDLPAPPQILTTSDPVAYDRSLTISWQTPTTTKHHILYFDIRIKKSSDDSKWRHLDEIEAKESQKKYSIVLDWLEWDCSYVIEIFAGNKFGASVPASVTITRPPVSYPEILEVSADKVGKHAVLEGGQFTLTCTVNGTPRPQVSWQFETYSILNSIRSKIEEGNLTMFDVDINDHQGAYRCLATNVFGTVMSRIIQVKVFSPDVFLNRKNHHDARPIVKHFKNNEAAIFRCPRRNKPYSAPTLSWGNRDHHNASKIFDIELSERVWITSKGSLVFHTFTRKDAQFINKRGGIRCILRRKTNDSKHQLVAISNLFKVNFTRSQTRGKRQSKFCEKPPKKLSLYPGDNLRLHCSALSSTRGKLVVKWAFEGKNAEKFRQSVRVSDFGRVLEYENVQFEGRVRIICTISDVKVQNNERKLRMKANTMLTVLSPKMPSENLLPRELSVYKGSNLTFRLEARASVLCWYFNGQCIGNAKDIMKAYRQFKVNRVTMKHSGIYQVDFRLENFGIVTATTYIQVFDDAEEGIVKTRADVKTIVPILPPASRSLHGLTFYISDPRNLENRRMWNENIVEFPDELKGKSFVALGVASQDTNSSFYAVLRWLKFLPMVPAVNGGWSPWSSWTVCPSPRETCNQKTTRSRKRTCTQPAPSLDGAFCSGTGHQVQSCPFVPCPKKVLSLWSPWVSWSQCSNKCGLGTKTRLRVCFKPLTNTQAECAGKAKENRRCYKRCPAPVLFYWSKWTACSKTCGFGTSTRTKICSKHERGEESCSRRVRRRCFKATCPGQGPTLNPSTEMEAFRSIMLVVLLALVFMFAIFFGITWLIQRYRSKKNYQQGYRRLETKESRRTLQELLGDQHSPLTKYQKPPPAKQRQLPTRKHLKRLAVLSPFDSRHPSRSKTNNVFMKSKPSVATTQRSAVVVHTPSVANTPLSTDTNVGKKSPRVSVASQQSSSASVVVQDKSSIAR